MAQQWIRYRCRLSGAGRAKWPSGPNGAAVTTALCGVISETLETLRITISNTPAKSFSTTRPKANPHSVRPVWGAHSGGLTSQARRGASLTCCRMAHIISGSVEGCSFCLPSMRVVCHMPT
jgi:hypothetical protein